MTDLQREALQNFVNTTQAIRELKRVLEAGEAPFRDSYFGGSATAEEFRERAPDLIESLERARTIALSSLLIWFAGDLQ